MSQSPEIASSAEAPRKGGKRRRRDWDETHEILADAYREFMTDLKQNPNAKQPTMAQLSKATGLSVRTVDRHLQELDRDINMARRTRKYRLLTDFALKGLAKQMVKGNVPAIRTWLETVEGMNLHAVVKVTAPEESAGPDMSNWNDQDVADYKALMIKAKRGKVGGDGYPESKP